MANLVYRQATPDDIPAMAEIRAADWGTEEYWRERIRLYLDAEHHPQHALPPRIAFVCADAKRVAGLIAGHLTRRFGCDGELEWISVRPEYRGRSVPAPVVGQGQDVGVASELLRRLAEWFVSHDARRICVDVQPSNHAARHFYSRHGATDLKPSWLVWEDISRLLI